MNPENLTNSELERLAYQRNDPLLIEAVKRIYENPEEEGPSSEESLLSENRSLRQAIESAIATLEGA